MRVRICEMTVPRTLFTGEAGSGVRRPDGAGAYDGACPEGAEVRAAPQR